MRLRQLEFPKHFVTFNARIATLNFHIAAFISTSCNNVTCALLRGADDLL
ncbi:MAG: hypothetical protein GPOALKHO_001276 [Sodalis sp.]|nr:MAG: hypothetical protein GPOALKHO_001276 [Sodalis sp.]